MSINFTARPVANPQIKHRTSFFKYSEEGAHIVELDRKDIADMKALNKTAKDWRDNSGKYADQIFERFNRLNNSDYVKEHVFALTTQQNDFKALESDKILGLMMFNELKGPENEILVLEVNPNTSKSLNFFRKYKDVGKRLVKYAQETFNNKGITVWSDYNAIKFYKKLGFEQPYRKLPKACELHWKV